MKKIVHSVFVILFLLSTLFLNAQTKIDQSKRELKENKPATISSRTSSSSSASTSNSSLVSDIIGSNNCYGSFIGDIFKGIFKAFVFGNYKGEAHLKNNLTKYPFYKCRGVNYTPLKDSFPKLFRVDMGYKYLNVDENLWGNQLNIKLRPSKYFYLQTTYNELKEKDLISHQTDNLSMFNFSFCYDRIRTEKFNLGWTIGARYVANDVQQGGFMYGTQIGFTLAKNVSVDANALFSEINKKNVNTVSASLNYHFKRVALTVGYEYMKIATPEYGFATFGFNFYL